MIKSDNRYFTSNNIFIFTLVAYIFFLPIQIKFIKIQFLYHFQISEIFFIILVLVTFKNTINNVLKTFNYSDYIVLMITMSGILSFSIGTKYYYSIGDLLVFFYFMFFYFFVKLNLRKEHVHLIINSLILSSLITSIFGLLGFVFLFLNFDTNLLFYIQDYPYFGNIYRIKSYMSSPSMFNSFVCLGLLLHLSKILFIKKEFKSHDTVILLIFISAIFLTYTKSVICIFWSCFFLYIISFNINLKYKIFILLFFTFLISIIYITSSHFIFEINNNIIRDSNVFATSDILHSLNLFGKQINIFQANYYYLKLSSLKAFYESPLFGVGIGNFNYYLDNLKQLGNFPSSFANWDPHSTLLGAASEQGIFGLITTSFFLIYSVFINFKKLDSEYAFVSNALLSYFVYIFIDSICLDIMNFRFVWIAFILSVFLSQQKINLSSRL